MVIGVQEAIGMDTDMAIVGATMPEEGPDTHVDMQLDRAMQPNETFTIIEMGWHAHPTDQPIE